jgi:uncharacterized protein (DUF1697 family)
LLSQQATAQHAAVKYLKKTIDAANEKPMALVVLLRGVNVGGHPTFRPKELAKQLVDLDVVNIGAAGTFVVRQPVTQAQLRAELTCKLPFETTIMICRGRDILNLMPQDHFKDLPERPDVVRFVSVLAKNPRSTPSTPVSFPHRGKWLVKILARQQRFVIGVYRRHMKAVRYLGEIDRMFGMPATTRNWNTIAAIRKVLGDGQT